MRRTLKFLIVIFLFLSSCGINNTLPERDHVLYHDTINPYFTIIAYPHHALDYSGETKEIVTYDIYMELSNTTLEEIVDVQSEIYGESFNGTPLLLYKDHNIFPENDKSFKIVNDMSVGGNGFKKIYGDLVYQLNNNLNKYSFSEQMLEVTENTIRKKDYLEEWTNEFLNIEFKPIIQDETYEVEIIMTFNSEKAHHLDLQTWILSNSSYGGVIPLLGVYNYSGNEGSLQFIIPVAKGFNLSQIYCRVNLWVENEKNEILFLYKSSINTK